MFMLLRREAFEQVGGFDERFFMYCEDFDLCSRLRLAGWQLQVIEAPVLHMAQRASKKSLRPLLWHLRSLMQVWMTPAFWSYAAMLQSRRGSDNGSGDQ
jgi:GT2 family glycosyltransferase